MAFDFTGKKILVTGAGRGIGRALSQAIIERGGEVYALSRTKETIDSLAAESERIHLIVADLSDWDRTRVALDELETMDGVVNNAAETLKSLVDALECPKETLEKALNVNVMGAINVIQATGKKMAAAGKGGSIVNVSSIVSNSAFKGAIYTDVSKAALDMVTKQFALELGPHQIRVNSVNPTVVLTDSKLNDYVDDDFTTKMKVITPMGRFCTTAEVTEPIMYLLSDHSTMVSGTTHVIDGGLLSHIPV